MREAALALGEAALAKDVDRSPDESAVPLWPDANEAPRTPSEPASPTRWVLRALERLVPSLGGLLERAGQTEPLRERVEAADAEIAARLAATGLVGRLGVREPHVEVLDERTELLLVAELPGVAEGDARVEVSGREATIEAHGSHARFVGRVTLPVEVVGPPRVAVRNGVLEARPRARSVPVSTEGRRRTMQLTRITERAKAQLAQATGLEPLIAPAAEHNDDGWHVTVEMVELHRIPEAQDVIGAYEVRLSEDGELLGWSRTGLRRRDDTDWNAE